MKVTTAWSTAINTEEAVSTAYAKVQRDLGRPPDWLAIHASIEHDSSVLINTLHRVAPAVPVHGGTSCLGVMTGEGFHAADGVGLGLSISSRLLEENQSKIEVESELNKGTTFKLFLPFVQNKNQE